ncbi:MAG: Vps62-related protein [Phycisphaerales bacterium]|nr:MAG: Vps62-related protein [Phycisphaerales bacterium]
MTSGLRRRTFSGLGLAAVAALIALASATVLSAGDPAANDTVRDRSAERQTWKHFLMRARMLYEQGRTASDVARLMRNAGLSAVRIGTVLRSVFSQDERHAVETLKNVGCRANEAYDVLTRAYDISDVILAERILDAGGYLPEEYLQFTARESVQEFAPVVKFDHEAWHLPMSAERWFNRMLCGAQGGPPFVDGAYQYHQCAEWDSESHDYRVPNDREVWSNPPPYGRPEGFRRIPAGHALMDVEDLEDSENPDGWWGTNGPQGGPNVPTYYKVMSNTETGALRIMYWWFYSYQAPCEWTMKYEIARLFTDRPASNGEHIGDWEHVMITTTPDRSAVEGVTYSQHGGHYTRWSSVEGFETEYDGYYVQAERPVVYVGKMSHGSYHDANPGVFFPLFSLACLYFIDHRSPWSDDSWFTDANLVDLRSNSESWMVAEGEPPPPGETERWRWGPTVTACSLYLLWTCWAHSEETAVKTHPTLRPPVGDDDVEDLDDWCFGSCDSDGCDEDQWSSISEQEQSNWNAWCPDGGGSAGQFASDATEDRADHRDGGPAFSAREFQEKEERITEVFTKVVAATLGMDANDLTAAVDAGHSVCQVVEARGLDLAETWVTGRSSRQMVLRQSVEDGLVTQAQADWIAGVLAEPPECPGLSP